MPAAVERCVASLLEKWKEDPTSRPEPRDEKQTAESQAWAICMAAYKKRSKSMEYKLEGPTILGCAATNRPFIKGLPPIRIEEEGEEKVLIVPMLRKGKFRHPDGLLVFDDNTFKKMIDNFKSGVVGIDISLDSRHKPELGALGWFKDIYVDGDYLVAKVKPTPTGLETIGNELYKYASVEFHPNWQDPEIKLSVDSICCEMEKDMEEELENDVVKEQDLRLLEETYRLELDKYAAKVLELERELLVSRVNSVLAEAKLYEDENGNKHSPFLLEWARNVLLMEPIGTIKLEGSESGNIAAYYRKAIIYLLENLPGQIRVGKETVEKDDKRLLEDSKADEEEIKKLARDFWMVI